MDNDDEIKGNDDEMKGNDDVSTMNTEETGAYEVGYGKPPKSGQFKKGASGNPSGRPKKPSDFYSAIMREGNAKVTFMENGKPKTGTMQELFIKQMWKNAATGKVHSQRLLIPLLQHGHETQAGQE